nr:hypothetical protein [Planococcus glaciei]
MQKISQAIFYILTVAFIFRDQYLDPWIINVLLGVTLGIVIVEIMQYKKKAVVMTAFFLWKVCLVGGRSLKQIQQTVCEKDEHTEKTHFKKRVLGKQLLSFLLFEKELDG